MDANKILTRYAEGERIFSDVSLIGEDLSGADLRDVNLNRANLSNANLAGARLKNANLSAANLSNANLKDADLSRCDLRSAILSSTCLLGANLENANLSDADISYGDLLFANVSNAELKNANLTEANFLCASLYCSNLCRANLKGAKLQDADLTKTNFSEANLSNTSLIDVKLTEANLKKANLSKSDISGAILTGANLSEALLDGIIPETVIYLVRDIEGIYNNIVKNLQIISNEEETKTALILPFIKMLGHDIHNTKEFRCEYPASFRKKQNGYKKSKPGREPGVDYAILINNTPLIFIEAKNWQEFPESHDGQLAEYYAASRETRIAIVTNGIIYNFFTDYYYQNLMDERPFFSFNFQNYTSTDIEFLVLFHRNFLDINMIRSHFLNHFFH